MSTLLTLAAVTALAVSPQCGAAKPDSELARQLVAHAQAESGFDPYVIHINVKGTPGYARHYASEVDAIVAAKELQTGHVSFDAGLMGINNANFAEHGLTLAIGSVFNACRNMRAGSDHLIDDVRAVFNLASRRYNCGGTDCGVAYANRVDELVQRTTAEVDTAVVTPSTTKEDPATENHAAQSDEKSNSADAQPVHDAVHLHRILSLTEKK